MTDRTVPLDGHRPLRPAEVASLFGVTARTIGRWTDAGHLQASLTVGGHRRYEPAMVAEALANPSRRAPAAPAST